MPSLCCSSPRLLPGRRTVWQRWVRLLLRRRLCGPPASTPPPDGRPQRAAHTHRPRPPRPGAQAFPTLLLPACLRLFPPRTLFPFVFLSPLFSRVPPPIPLGVTAVGTVERPTFSPLTSEDTPMSLTLAPQFPAGICAFREAPVFLLGCSLLPFL